MYFNETIANCTPVNGEMINVLGGLSEKKTYVYQYSGGRSLDCIGMDYIC